MTATQIGRDGKRYPVGDERLVAVAALPSKRILRLGDLDEALAQVVPPEETGGAGMELISESVLSSSAANFDLVDIPDTFRHLRLVAQLRCDKAAANAEVRVRFNGDTAAVYDWEHNFGAGVVEDSSGAAAVAFILAGYTTAASAAAGQAGLLDVAIPNYRGTTFEKRLLGNNAYFAGTTAADHTVQTVTGRRRTVDAVERITVFPDTGNWIAGSVLSLYGLAAA